MKNICFYISDYGFGHASRSIAIVRAIIKSRPDVKFFLKADTTYDFLKQSLSEKNIEVIRTKNDIGIVADRDSFSIDGARTEAELSRWVGSWNEYLDQERSFCKSTRIDLVLSDVPPQPFIVSKELGIPGVAISNFSWHLIFSRLFGNIEDVKKLQDAYSLADIALVLPYDTDMSIFPRRQDIGLISREITVNRDRMRRNIGINRNDLLIYASVGIYDSPELHDNVHIFNGRNVRFIASANCKPCMDNVITIPGEETEIQNYIAMCDLVISKVGYSTVSEATRGKVPMLLFRREGFAEDVYIANTVKHLGIGNEISKDSLANGEWISELKNIDAYKHNFDTIDERYKKDGTEEVVEVVDEALS